jgi:ABC-2 type transport system ATP-binding protein
MKWGTMAITMAAEAHLAIEVQGLRKQYGDKQALDGLDLSVRQDEIFALLGPNGAGKTTTVEILEGYRRRDAGSVRVLGVDPARADRAWRSRIGIVTQSATDQPELTVGEIVHHFARYYPDPRDPDEVIEAVGLTEKVRSRISELSGGQRRRLDVALGILGRPELLFLDEPTTGFDPEARRSFWDLLAGLRHGGTTILLTTHYLDEAQHLADRVAVVRDGRVLALATPADLGGRAVQRAIVRWTEPGPDGGSVRHCEERTDAPEAFIRALKARKGLAADAEVPGLEVLRPSLEDVYLAMIDEPAGAGQAVAAPEGTAR